MKTSKKMLRWLEKWPHSRLYQVSSHSSGKIIYQRRLFMGMALAPPMDVLALHVLPALWGNQPTSIAATTATATTVTATAESATTTATVSDHLSQTGVNLLFGLLKDVHEVTSLLGV